MPTRKLPLPHTRTPGAPITDLEVEAWGPYVAAIQRRFLPKVPRNSRPDIESAAALGLVQALTTWDPKRGGLQKHVYMTMVHRCRDVLRAVYGRPGNTDRSGGAVGAGERHEKPMSGSSALEGSTNPNMAARLEREEAIRHAADVIGRVRSAVAPEYWDELVDHEVHGVTVTELARRRGVTQPRVSQVMKRSKEQARRAAGDLSGT